MGEVPCEKWRAAIPRVRRLAVLQNEVLGPAIRIMGRYDPNHPRPILEDIAVELHHLGIYVSPRTIRRCFIRIVGKSFRAFVTGAILAWARRDLSHPDASVNGTWRRLNYKWGRALERLFAKHMKATPGRFLPSAT